MRKLLMVLLALTMFVCIVPAANAEETYEGVTRECREVKVEPDEEVQCAYSYHTSGHSCTYQGKQYSCEYYFTEQCLNDKGTSVENEKYIECQSASERTAIKIEGVLYWLNEWHSVTPLHKAGETVKPPFLPR